MKLEQKKNTLLAWLVSGKSGDMVMDCHYHDCDTWLKQVRLSCTILKDPWNFCMLIVRRLQLVLNNERYLSCGDSCHPFHDFLRAETQTGVTVFAFKILGVDAMPPSLTTYHATSPPCSGLRGYQLLTYTLPYPIIILAFNYHRLGDFLLWCHAIMPDAIPTELTCQHGCIIVIYH